MHIRGVLDPPQEAVKVATIAKCTPSWYFANIVPLSVAKATRCTVVPTVLRKAHQSHDPVPPTFLFRAWKWWVQIPTHILCEG